MKPPVQEINNMQAMLDKLSNIETTKVKKSKNPKNTFTKQMSDEKRTLINELITAVKEMQRYENLIIDDITLEKIGNIHSSAEAILDIAEEIMDLDEFDESERD